MAQALVRFLNQQYVEFDGVQQRFVKGIFSIFGHGNVVGLGQALEEDAGELIVHQGRSEQGMAHAAIGYAKQMNRRQIYACTTSIGPGATNMVTAAAAATVNRIPVLLLPGDVFVCRQPDPVLQQVEQFYDAGITANDAFKPVCRYWDRVVRPEQLMNAMLSALRVLTDPADTGAVCICLPQDTQGEAFDYPEYFFEKRVHRIERTPPTEEMVKDAAEAISRAKKPLMICGGGVKFSEAGDAMMAFAESFHIPFGETQAGKGAVAYDHPLNLGGIGAMGCLAANTIAAEADLVIGLGTRYSDFTTASKWQYQKAVRFVNINIAAFDARKLDAIPVRADIRAALEAIGKALKAQNYRSAYKDEIKAANAEWAAELERLYGADCAAPDFVPEISGHWDNDQLRKYSEYFKGGMTQTKVLGILDSELDPDAVVVASSGSLPGDLMRMWRTRKPGGYNMEYGYSTMGYEVCAALGVKLACPSQEVYSLLGDGSFMMLHSELATSLQEGAKINLIVFDNNGFGCINNLQIERGQEGLATEFRRRNTKTGMLDGELAPVDFAKIGEGYGAKSYSVRTEEQLRAALRDAKQQPCSTLIDIKVLPKTMSHGYASFWRCGTAEVARNPRIVELTEKQKSELGKARAY
jgi:3D-(3,5/4)-trihydroxycyclohexane-1,2-dione acylhydrolase (decyclizing)